MATKYKRGFTTRAPGPPDRPPPPLTASVFNEFAPRVRGATMSPPTGDTQEPRLSRWEGGPVKGPMARGGLAAAPRPAVTVAIAARPAKGKPMTKGKR